MKNDVLFKNIFLNQACLSSFKKVKENLKQMSDTIDVLDNGEWSYKLNVAVSSFLDIDETNLDPTAVEKVIRGVQDFVEILENSSPQDDLDLQIIKDFEFIRVKYDMYKNHLKSHVLINKPDVTTLENVADFICGDNKDKYPLYRSSFYLTKFFNDIHIDVEHDGSTRKVWVLSVLQNLSVYDLNKVILRLVDIRIYKGDREDWLKAVKSMNDVLFLEDLQLNVEGKNVSIVASGETNMEKNNTGPEEDGDNFQNMGIVAGGSISAGGDIVVSGDKTIQQTQVKKDESGLSRVLWSLLIPIVVIVVATGIVFWFGWV